jgi:hypothetical protein
MNVHVAPTRHGLFWLGASLAVGLIISTVLAMNTVRSVKLANQTISVKGCAERVIDSDEISWSATISSQAPQMAEAYNKLKNDLSVLLDYLETEGIPKEDVNVSSISRTVLYGRDEHGNRTDTVTGYRLSQSVRIRSGDLDRVTRISKECTNLMAKGLGIDSGSPDYFCTKIDDLKLEMLGEAARDARQRAEQLVKDSGSKVGALRSSSQGVFQITSAYSTDISDYGIHDTSCWTKKIRAVVTVRYSIR